MSVAPSQRRALIVSGHPLFSAGLRNLLRDRHVEKLRGHVDVEVVGLANSIEEALTALGTLKPDIVIVDCDDKTVNREAFLARFVEGGSPMRVVLVSLKEGGEVVVYDRRTLAPTQMVDWLEAALTTGGLPESKQ